MTGPHPQTPALRDGAEAPPAPGGADRPLPAGTDPARIALRCLVTGDLHAHLAPWDYFNDRPAPGHGLVRTAHLLRAARAEAANCVYFDNGDLLQGSTLGDVVHRDWDLGEETHPVIAALDDLRCDAGALGNHDLDFGLEWLARARARARHPLVCANLVAALGETPAEDRHLFPPHVLLEREMTDTAGRRHRLRIGVLGVLPPQVLDWNHKHLAGRVLVRGIAETVRAFVPVLRAAGADLVVVLAHTGFSDCADPDHDTPGAEHAALSVAGIPGIDLLVAGHTHHAFPAPGLPPHPQIDAVRGRVAGVPTLMAGQYGSHLGIADLSLVQDPQGWRVEAAVCEARPIARRDERLGLVPCAPEDAAIAAIAAEAHAMTLAHVRRHVGRSAVPLASYFAHLGADACLQIVAEAQARHVAGALGTGPHAGLPVIAAVSPFRAGGRGGPEAFVDIPPGNLSRADIAGLYLYPNCCSALRLSGAEIAEWLETSAASFRRLEPGRADQPLLDPAFPSYNFDVLFGLTYEIDLSQPARYGPDGQRIHPDARRIRDIRIDGRLLGPSEEVVLATNDYRASGAGHFAGAGRTRVIYESPMSIRSLIAARLLGGEVYDPVIPEVWRFRPLPGASAIYPTGPGAVRHLAEIARYAPEPAGFDAEGFLRLRLRL